MKKNAKKISNELEFECYYSIKNNDLERLKTLVNNINDYCEKIQPYGQSLLLHACLTGNLGIVNYLISKNCKVNQPDRNVLYPLHAAVEYNFVEIAKILIQHNAYINVQDKYGNTPILNAVFHSKGNMEMVDLLLLNGADPFIKNNYGVNALEFAKKIGLKQAIEHFKSNVINKDRKK